MPAHQEKSRQRVAHAPQTSRKEQLGDPLAAEGEQQPDRAIETFAAASLHVATSHDDVCIAGTGSVQKFRDFLWRMLQVRVDDAHILATGAPESIHYSTAEATPP